VKGDGPSATPRAPVDGDTVADPPGAVENTLTGEGQERLPTDIVRRPNLRPASLAPTERPVAAPLPSFDPASSFDPQPTPLSQIDSLQTAALTPGPTTHESPMLPSPFAGLLAEAHAQKPGVDPGAPTIPASLPMPSLPALPPAPINSAPAPRPATAPSKELRPSQAPVSAVVHVPTIIPDRRVGPYRVLEELGSGGMAVVYKAVQPALDRLVALKELRSEYVHDRQIATRFEREATSLATLQHGNIVHVYDFLRDEESAYIVMEFVEGIDLFDVLSQSGRMPSDIAALIGSQVAEGLEYAHYRGIVHRDIKPSNILVSKKGEVKIMDFGIARDPGKSELTQVGLAVGTPAYMAPEQIRGDRIDFRTDIFAFGIVLYEMLAGDKPWTEEEGRSVTVKVLDEDYPRLRTIVPSVPPELEQVIDRCLAKDPQRRYRSTYELRRDLELYVQRSVPIDPRGRMVLYLRNRGLISDAEATNFVEPELLLDGQLRRRDEGVPLPPAMELMRPVGAAYGVALILTVVATLITLFFPIGEGLPSERPVLVPRAEAAQVDQKAIEAEVLRRVKAELEKRPSEPGGPRLPEAPAQALRGDEGFVKVVVKPWARVFVDGTFYDFTPFDRPLALAPGRHRIGLRNPYSEPVDKVIDVETKKTQILKVVLEPRGGEDDED
jgi:eukaryotic-like serine/threonine-protein kinase